MAKEVGLAAYTNRLSGRPGDTIRFYISSRGADGSSSSSITAKLTRCICADPNPAGPGCIEEDASNWFPPREIMGRHQLFYPGSYAKSRDVICVSETMSGVSVEIWVYPTVIESDGSEATNKSSQCIWSWGNLGLYMKRNGCLSLCYNGNECVGSNETSLMSNNWYHIKASIGLIDGKSTWQLFIMQINRLTKKETELFHGEYVEDIAAIIPMKCHFELASGGSFNGRLENPRITMSSAANAGCTEQDLLLRWDTSKNMTEWSIPLDGDISNPLILYNHPTRAVRGHLWDGTEFCWKHKPTHYSAVHFHDDDVYDFDWKCDMEWKIPVGMPSGIYVMRLVNDENDEEALPLFICPSIDDSKKKKLCILISTFTYVMYGNHARADFESRWLDRIPEWNAYPHNPTQYPHYGRSTYNYHTDMTGICFASHLRPLFNLRPKYLTFGGSSCSGLRHFPADTHLIAWMHHHNIDYDIITDHELHKEGVASIAGYQTLMTGSHPEYHTLESLNALQQFRDDCGGNFIYLGGNGFYWRIAAKDEDASILEIRRAEAGIRFWASEPGEYHHMLDGGNYGGLWRRNDRPPQQLVGVGFTAQGSFVGMPYKRICFEPEMDWLFEGIEDIVLGDFGFSGNGAAGFELDRADRKLDGHHHKIVILAQSFDKDSNFILVPEEVLTTYSNLAGCSNDEARRSDMLYFQTSSSAQVFSVGSITFCGSLPWNDFDNNISCLLKNVVQKFSS